MAYPQMYSPFVLGRCTKDVDWDGIYKNLKQNGSNFFKVDTLIQMGIIQAKVGSVLGRSPFVQGRKEDRSFVMTIGVADNESREVFTEFTLHLNPNGRKACECFNLTLELLQAGTQEQRRQHIRTRNGLQFRAPCHSKQEQLQGTECSQYMSPQHAPAHAPSNSGQHKVYRPVVAAKESHCP